MGDITVKTEAKHICYIQKTRVILAELYNMLTENLDNTITDMIKQKRDLITEHITCENQSKRNTNSRRGTILIGF
jgi:hypothetical protein